MAKITEIPRIPVLFLIRIYQKFLSPDHSFWAKRIKPHGYCRFFPTCSEYGHDAIQKYGVVRGGMRTVWRIMRCNPWNSGGTDIVK